MCSNGAGLVEEHMHIMSSAERPSIIRRGEGEKEKEGWRREVELVWCMENMMINRPEWSFRSIITYESNPLDNDDNITQLGEGMNKMQLERNEQNTSSAKNVTPHDTSYSRQVEQIWGAESFAETQ